MRLFKYITLFAVAIAFSSCSDDEIKGTIFPDIPTEPDPTSYTYKFDKWLKVNYLDVYNLDFKYKLQDISTNMNYNLVPADLNKAQDLAVLTKYLWFDVYKKVVDDEFLKKYGPRIIHLIGSPAYNPQSGTETIGLAEGGVKVSLFKVNALDNTDILMMNEYYFKTMHHEFAHILHQTKSYPKEFNTLSTGHYDSSNWQDRNIGVVNSLGFPTKYASSETREDFAEIIANYIVLTQSDWDLIFEYAARGWQVKDAESDTPEYFCWYYYKNNEASEENIQYPTDKEVETIIGEDGKKTYVLKGKTDTNGNAIKVFAAEDKDGVDGVAVLNQKITIAKNWFKEAWGANLEELRNEVQTRQTNINIEALREEINNIQ
ncbi:MAG: putative zinc-binding metallopeptidase [Muribaculaceae bacterium]|nr:putative zinc-binding metallopeptidase [Muribaculaceae bacterium]